MHPKVKEYYELLEIARQKISKMPTERKKTALFVREFLYFLQSKILVYIGDENIGEAVLEAHTIYLWRETAEDCKDFFPLVDNIDSSDISEFFLVFHLQDIESISIKILQELCAKITDKAPDCEIIIGFSLLSKEQEVVVPHLNGLACAAIYKDKPLSPPKYKNTIVLNLQHLNNQTTHESISF